MSPASPLMLSKPSCRPASRLPARRGCGHVSVDHEKCNSVYALTQPSVPKAILVEAASAALSDRHAPERQASSDMDDRTTETALSLTKFGVGQPVRRSEDPKLVRGEGCYTDDLSRPGQAYAVMVRSRDAHGVIRVNRHRRRQSHAGRAGGLYRRRSVRATARSNALLPLKSRDGSPIRYTPRPALAGDKVRFVGDPVACVDRGNRCAGKGRGRGGDDRYRAVAGRAQAARDAVKPGAPLVFDAVPEQCRARLPLWRRRESRRRLRQGQARHAAGDLQSAHGRQRHGAARGDRRIRRGGRQMDALFVEPGRLRHEDLADGYSERACRQGARGDRPGRRLVRHEGRGLSGIRLHPARRPHAGPAGEMDRRALRQFRVRSSWPRAGHGDGNRVRRERAYPGDASHRLWRHGRLPRPVRPAAADRQSGQEHRQRLPHAADRSGDQMRVHQYKLCVGLSRRRPARRQLLYRARARPCRQRARHRSHRIAQAQHDPQERSAVQGRVRHDL